DHAAARGYDRAAATRCTSRAGSSAGFAARTRIEQLVEFTGARIAHLNELGAQRREFGNLALIFQFQFFTRSNFGSGRNEQHVADLTLVEPLRLQDQLERLVPRDVLQTQRDSARYRVARDEVQVGEVGDQLQYRTHFDVLEIQRQFFTLVLERIGALFHVLGSERIDVDRQGLIRLIREVVVVALR